MMLAAPYSGATLFALVLDRDEHLCCDGETFSLRPDQDCSCGSRQIECPYYSNVAAHMRRDSGNVWNRRLFRHTPRYTGSSRLNWILSGHIPVDPLNSAREWFLRLPPFGRTRTEFVEAQRLFVENCVRHRRVDVYVDGSKIPGRAEIFARSHLFDLSVIHLVRDGRGFCNSFRKNTGEQDLAVAAKRWNRELSKVDVFRRRYPEVPVHVVRYEDLCNDLGAAMTGIRTFLQIPDTGPVSFDTEHDHHVIGNRMRRRFDGVIREDLTWKEQISGEDLRLIESIMKPGMGRYGYFG